MVHYFYLLRGESFAEMLRPLAESWRARSFVPVRTLAAAIAATHRPPSDAVVRLVADGLRFDRRVWQALVGECLVLTAEEVPRLETAPATFIALVAPDRIGADATVRASATPIEQIHFGSRDLRLGTWYRPDYVGWNDASDVARLLAWMQTIDLRRWNAADLAELPEFEDAAERDEELAFARDWWPALVEMYAGAHAAGQIIVCERT